MKKSKLYKPEEIPSRHLFEELPWSLLTDTQKSQLLLGSTRMLDAETYLHDFTSWEQPEAPNVQIADTS